MTILHVSLRLLPYWASDNPACGSSPNRQDINDLKVLRSLVGTDFIYFIREIQARGLVSSLPKTIARAFSLMRFPLSIDNERSKLVCAFRHAILG